MSTTRVLMPDLKDEDPASPLNPVIEVEMPPGHYRVWGGALKPGDLYLDEFRLRDGVTSWEPVTWFPTAREARLNRPYSSAGWYLCVVRRGAEVVPPCERCGVAVRAHGLRYCRYCAAVIAGK
jgi:hypothetical protein